MMIWSFGMVGSICYKGSSWQSSQFPHAPSGCTAIILSPRWRSKCRKHAWVNVFWYLQQYLRPWRKFENSPKITFFGPQALSCPSGRWCIIFKINHFAEHVWGKEDVLVVRQYQKSVQRHRNTFRVRYHASIILLKPYICLYIDFTAKYQRRAGYG